MLKHDEKLGNYIEIRWCVEDVHSLGLDLTDEQAIEVLLDAKKNHDASIGINWEVLEGIASTVLMVDTMFKNGN
jgi:hypothetical protein